MEKEFKNLSEKEKFECELCGKEIEELKTLQTENQQLEICDECMDKIENFIDGM